MSLHNLLFIGGIVVFLLGGCLFFFGYFNIWQEQFGIGLAAIGVGALLVAAGTFGVFFLWIGPGLLP